MATLNISMPDAMRECIDAQIDAGEYAKASDYIRDLIRNHQRQRDALRLALIEGEESVVSDRTCSFLKFGEQRADAYFESLEDCLQRLAERVCSGGDMRVSNPARACAIAAPWKRSAMIVALS